MSADETLTLRGLKREISDTGQRLVHLILAEIHFILPELQLGVHGRLKLTTVSTV